MEGGQTSGARKAILLEQNQTSKLRGSLIGRLEVSKELNKSTVLTMMQKGWNLTGDVEVLDIDKNVFSFQFAEREDYLKVLRGRPWAIQSHLLNIQLWDDEMVFKEVCFDKSPFWVQFHGLPFIYMNSENAFRMGSSIGEVVMVENPKEEEKLVRKFLRARILVNINDPLVTGFWVPRKNKEDVWAEVKYERLPSICYRCGRLGHEQRLCSHSKQLNEEDSKFGSWLKASPTRYMEELIIPIDSQWCEITRRQGKKKRGEILMEERVVEEGVWDCDRAVNNVGNSDSGGVEISPQKLTDT